MNSSLNTSNNRASINTPRCKPTINSSRTVRLGINDYIIPNIDFLDFKLDNSNALDLIIRTSSLDNIDSIVNLPSIRQVEAPKKEKILIVDDNHYISEATQNILKKVLTEACRNMEIILASDGVDILHHVIQDQSKGNEIKCILTDENMEYMNGSEAIRIIRGLEKRNKTKFVKIISVTGNEESQYIDKIKSAGAQLVMGKPLSKLLLAKFLKDLNII